MPKKPKPVKELAQLHDAFMKYADIKNKAAVISLFYIYFRLSQEEAVESILIFQIHMEDPNILKRALKRLLV